MDLLEHITKNIRSWIEATDGNDFVVNPPATDETLRSLEKIIGKSLPKELAILYKQSSGIWDTWFCFNILSAEELIEYNLNIRNDETAKPYKCRNDHLAFSHRDGDYYFYLITPSGCDGIYRWDHEDDSRTFECQNLKQWVDGQIDGL